MKTPSAKAEGVFTTKFTQLPENPAPTDNNNNLALNFSRLSLGGLGGPGSLGNITKNEPQTISDPILQGIALLNAYSKGLEIGVFTQADFIRQYGVFTSSCFNNMLSSWTQENVQVKQIPDSLIPTLSSTSELTSQFANLFLNIPSLKEELRIDARLVENIKPDHLRLHPLAWRTIFFIQSIQSPMWEIVDKLQQIASESNNNWIKTSFFRDVLGLTLNQIEKSTANDPHLFDKLRKYLDTQLTVLYQFKDQLNPLLEGPYSPQVLITGKIIHCLDTLLNKQDQTNEIKQLCTVLQKHLPNYFLIALNALDPKSKYSYFIEEAIAQFCQPLISMQSKGLSLDGIFTLQAITPLNNIVKAHLQLAFITDGRDGRPECLGRIGLALQRFLPIVDFAGADYGKKWLEELHRLHRKGGKVVSGPAIANCQSEVERAVAQYEPYTQIPSLIDRNSFYLERFWFIYSNFFTNNFEQFRMLYTLVKKKKLAAWLEQVLPNQRYQPQYREYYNFYTSLKKSIQEEENTPVASR